MAAGWFFDFDDLEEAESESEASAGADDDAEVRSETSSTPSEVYDGEELDLEDLGALDVIDAPGPRAPKGARGIEVAEEGRPRANTGSPKAWEPEPETQEPEAEAELAVWEVVYVRVAVRKSPDLDAQIVSGGLKRELFFENPDSSQSGWVRLVQGGYILKDGSVKGLGVLLERFGLPAAVPGARRQEVLRLLRDAWEGERERTTGFLPQDVIDQLRRAFADAVNKASRADGAFDMAEFGQEFTREVRTLSATHRESFVATKPLGRALAAQVSSGPGARTGRAAWLPNQVRGAGESKLPWAYDAPTVSGASGELSWAYAKELIEALRRRSLPSEHDATSIVTRAFNLFAAEESLVRLRVPDGATLHVVGDVHGQFWDLLHILDTHGQPSESNWYLFNGDFVDRGQYSVEVALALFAMKAAVPQAVHVNRGNHEAIRMNALYGFTAEVARKYSSDLYALFVQVFRCIPLATVVNSAVFVVHGGLPRRDGVKLAEIARLDRRREPDEGADELMVDMLWSDPMERLGRDRSPRGAGCLFGPDVTERFCEDNGLTCVIRSHELKTAGFEWHHSGRCLTIFSAANYCGVCGNRGAVCNITPGADSAKIVPSDFRLQAFNPTEQPEERSSGFGFPNFF